MADGRDDFTQNTIRIAAGRVGYNCSFPGCHNATIGASMESDDKTSITGVAAHICAAAEGGPRYDKDMTPEKRKSVNNCIWMCQTHARLIDTDEVTYTTDELRKWKKDAEEVASKALADVNYFNNYYKSNGENFIRMKQIFDNMIIDGQFELLHTMLEQYTANLSEKYNEFVRRYRIIYDTYCCHSSLKDDLEKYIILTDKSGINDLVELFLSFLMVEELKVVIEVCHNQELKDIAILAIKGELEGKLFIPIGENAEYSVSNKYTTTILKIISNIIRKRKLIEALDKNGNSYPLYKDEFYYQIIAASHGVAYLALYNDNGLDVITTNNDFAFIKKNISKIKCLDPELQLPVWSMVLPYLLIDKDQFNHFYELCPDSIKVNATIKRARYQYLITYEKSNITPEELLHFSEENTNYNILLQYLMQLSPNEELTYLIEHQFLYSRSSHFLYRRLIVLTNERIDIPTKFLEKFRAIYQNDFMFHCLYETVSNDPEEKHTELLWLKKNSVPLDGLTTIFYLSILSENKEWDELESLSHSRLPHEYLFRIAIYLADSNEEKYMVISEKILSKLIQQGWNKQWLFFNCGIAQQMLGRVEEAKRSYQKEYDLYKHENSLKNLLFLRFETNDIVDDQYLNDLKEYIDAQAQNLLGAFYLRLENYPEARKYLLRSLLLDSNNNPSISGYWLASCRLPNSEIKKIKADTVCTLKSDVQTIMVALHTPDIIDGISPNDFSNCHHYSSEDPLIAPLMFREVGDTVYYQSAEYSIVAVSSTEGVFIPYALSIILQSPGTMRFSTATLEEFVSNITPIMKASSDDLNRHISDYNEMEIRLPLSIFANITGKGMLASCEFLAYGNPEKIRNNIAALNLHANECKFILSYDSIIFLTHIGIENIVRNNLCLRCAAQVKHQLVSDIDEELSRLTSDSEGSSLIYVEGKVSLLKHTADSMRERYSFLTKLKAFANAIDSNSSYDFSCEDTVLQGIFAQKKLYCEGGTLGLAQNLANSVIVTDDQFLYIAASSVKINHIGISSLLVQSGLNWEQLLLSSKQLAKINYANYLPLELYKKVVDLVIEDTSQADRGSKDIFQWLISDTDNEPSSHHCKVIITLFRDVYSTNLDYLNPNNSLFKLAFQFFNKLNPGFINKYVEDALSNLQIEIQQEINS